MDKSIVLNFPKLSSEDRYRLTESVNSRLFSIYNEINNWNGFIDVRKTEDGHFFLIAKCDNEELRCKMQGFLDVI